MSFAVNISQSEGLKYVNIALSGIKGLDESIRKLELPLGHDLAMKLITAKLALFNLRGNAAGQGQRAIDDFAEFERQIDRFLLENVSHEGYKV